MKKIIVFLILIALIANANALINIDLNVKPAFELSEMIYFEYSFISDENTIIDYVPFVNCQNAPVPFVEQKTIELEKNKLTKENYNYIKASDNIEPQTCTAIITILSPEKQVVQKEFKIKTNPSFTLEIKTCKDKECLQETKVITKTENLFIVSETEQEIQNLIIKATLTKPDGISQEIKLPFELKDKQIGSYEVQIKASAPGFKDNSQIVQFAVIKKTPEIKNASTCNGNEVCEMGENYQNCPLDCKEGETGKQTVKEENKQETEKENILPANPVQNIIDLAIGIIIGLVVLIGLFKVIPIIVPAQENNEEKRYYRKLHDLIMQKRQKRK